MTNSKPAVAVIFGSRSPEHDVSIITGQLIISGLKGLDYQVVPVYLGKSGEWLIDDSLGEMKTFTDPKGSAKFSGFSDFYLDLEESRGRLVFRKKGLLRKTIVADVVFPAVHGAFGEDGTLQGFLEMLNVPYVGCNVASSAIAMDKVLTKLLYERFGIPTTKFIYFGRGEFGSNSDQILGRVKQELKFPVFVKPARLGSSIGIAKIQTPEEMLLKEKIEVALSYDKKVLVEEGVKHLMDVTCCVLGNEEPEPSLLQESLFQSDLFDFETKYLKGGGAQFGKGENALVIPARLPQDKTAEIRKLAVKIFKLFGCSGIARVDFLFDKERNKYFANEINTLPGTLYHHLWEKSGIKLPELLKRLIDSAFEVHQSRREMIETFESSLLREASAVKLQIKKNA